MADLLREFGDVLFWHTPLPEVPLCEVIPGEVNEKGEVESLGRSAEEIGVQLERRKKNGAWNNDGDQHVDSLSSINMVLVEFSLNKQAMAVAEEVFEVVREVEMLLREKSATFVASEWLSEEEGKMEVVMREKDEAEALVEQLNETIWHPLVSLVVTLNVVPSLAKSSVVGKSRLKESKEGKVEADLHFPSTCPAPVSSSKASDISL